MSTEHDEKMKEFRKQLRLEYNKWKYTTSEFDLAIANKNFDYYQVLAARAEFPNNSISVRKATESASVCYRVMPAIVIHARPQSFFEKLFPWWV